MPAKKKAGAKVSKKAKPALPDPKVLEPQFRIEQAIADFYTLMSVQPLFDPRLDAMNLNSGRRKVFDDCWYRMIPGLSLAFRDYCTLVCYGEMRHAGGRCSHNYSVIMSHRQAIEQAAQKAQLKLHEQNPENESSHVHYSSRTYAGAEALLYEPVSILNAAKDLFGRQWLGDFGGQSWLSIAEAGLQYGKWEDVVFIDHAVDLSHNSGAFVDKNVIFRCEDIHDYKYILDAKRNGTAKDIAKALIHTYTPVSYAVRPLWVRLVGEELAKDIPTADTWSYRPIPWQGDTFPISSMQESDGMDDEFDPDDTCFTKDRPDAFILEERSF